MVDIILRGHKVSKGKTEGEALVSRQPISFKQGVNPKTGVVIERKHELEGVSLAEKILVFPVEKGSTQGSYAIFEMARCKVAPKGIINLRAGSIVALGAIVSDIPMMDRLDADPLEVIKTGDYVELDADNGVVKVRHQG